MIVNTFLILISTSILACIVTTAGILAITHYENWGKENAVYFMSFAAGVLISVSLIHIIPNAIAMNDNSPIFLLAGFISFYVFNRFLTANICHEYECENLTIGIIPMLGVGMHSFLDGVIYSVTFSVSIFTGILAAIGMVLHEFPEGIVTFLLLERGGFTQRAAARYAFLAAAISTPLGTLISYPFIERIETSSLGSLLAYSAGALLYVGASHLLPAVEKEKKKYSIIYMGVGILVAIIIVLSKG